MSDLDPAVPGVPRDPTAPAASSADARLRAQVDRLLTRAPARSTGSLNLADGRTLAYEACVDFLPVIQDGFAGADAEPQAAVMTTAYVAQGVAAEQRPVCFAFNGGPGSASIWLHLGALGPRRVVVPDDASMPAAPCTVVDNPHSWLTFFDLVFVDPPQTGWSLAASEAARRRVLSVDGDVAALAEVMRAWLTRHRRWRSPLYLAGESYGTTRAAALADRLQTDGLALSGLILVSCAMDLQSLVFAPGNDLPYAVFLPGMAVVSQYHGLLKGALGASPGAARAAAEAFVESDYAAALWAGHRLDERRRGRVARRIAELTGLSVPLVLSQNLRISDRFYFLHALRSRGQVVGRLDARAAGPLPAQQGHEWEFDPGIEAIAAPYTLAALGHFSQTLGVDLPQRYEVLSRDAHKHWNWNRGEEKGNGYASTSPDLARALRRNPQLRVLVASGRYDLGTPYSATDWSLAQLNAPAAERARIRHHYYEAGHMMYTRQADLVQLHADLGAWLG